MNEAEPIRILITDDHPVVREGMASLIQHEHDMTVVGEAANGDEALALFRQHRPDITLMDLRMPGAGGVAAIAVIRDEFPHARVIVLTTFDENEDIRRALHAGAKGYLLKDAGREALLEAIRAVHAGQTRVSPEMATRVMEQARGLRLSDEAKRAVAERPLWLTAEQVGTLLSLSSTSSLRVGAEEEALFNRLSDYLRHFEG